MPPRSKVGPRESEVRKRYEAKGWVVYGTGHGAADLVALREGKRPRLLQVKTSRDGPYKHFGPSARRELRDEAEQAGADATLIWWPADRNGARFLDPEVWPDDPPPAA